MTQHSDSQQNASTGSSAAPANPTENSAQPQGQPQAHQNSTAAGAYSQQGYSQGSGYAPGGYTQSGYAQGSYGQAGHGSAGYSTPYGQAQGGSGFYHQGYQHQSAAGQTSSAPGQMSQNAYYAQHLSQPPAERKPNFFTYVTDLKFDQPLTRPVASTAYIVILAFSFLAWLGFTVQSFQYGKVYGFGSAFFNLFAGLIALFLVAGLSKMTLEAFLRAAQKHGAAEGALAEKSPHSAAGSAADSQGTPGSVA